MKENEIVIERIFSCPKEKLFEVWNSSKWIEKWYGPPGFNTKVILNDFTSGGKWEYLMKGPEGMEYPVKGEFLLIEKDERVVSTDGWKDNPESVSGMVLTAEFFDVDIHRSQLVLTTTLKDADEKAKWEQMGVAQAWESSFVKLDEALRG